MPFSLLCSIHCLLCLLISRLTSKASGWKVRFFHPQLLLTKHARCVCWNRFTAYNLLCVFRLFLRRTKQKSEGRERERQRGWRYDIRLLDTGLVSAGAGSCSIYQRQICRMAFLLLFSKWFISNEKNSIRSGVSACLGTPAGRKSCRVSVYGGSWNVICFFNSERNKINENDMSVDS